MKHVIDNKLENKLAIDNKAVFFLKTKATVVVNSKRGCFVADNAFFFSLVCETVVDNYAFRSMFVASGFFPCTRIDMRGER